MTLFRLIGLLALLALSASAQTSWAASERLDAVIEEAIGDRAAPGAVLLVGRGERILHYKAYGRRSVTPKPTRMTLDTVFDCASLTKVVVTAPSILMLVEQGRIRLDDPVAKYLEGFAAVSRRITIRQLLTHYSGLRPDLDFKPEWSGYETGIRMAFEEIPVAGPGERFLYSDINYILLAELVRKIMETPFEQWARESIFEPLGMTDSRFLPPASLRERIAPTERLPDGTVLRGVVHDPTTRYMGGVSGHAGMFSTAADLGRFCRMMLNGGVLDAKRILSPLAVAQMTTPQTPPGKAERGLGWDINSRYASNRGDLFPVGSYGHTGFTGTSLWLDPLTKTYVVLMTNRVHPNRASGVVDLRGRVASIVAAALIDLDVDLAREAVSRGSIERPAPRRRARNGETLTGLDVLVRGGFAPLKGKRIGLITNHSGLDHRGRRNVDLIARAEGVTLAAILSPEHGFEGKLEQRRIADASDPATGVKIYSLYQPGRRRPAAEMLEGLDALVFDIQDVGARFYTYSTTMAYAMEEAAKRDIEFYVLDRPNPINGVSVEGPALDPERRSFVGYFAGMPVRHGMTVGELARLFNRENEIGAKLTVIPMEGWRREDFFDETGLRWVNPSPNIRSFDQALLYPGVALLEGMPNWSVGRGTDAPFEFVGADWLDGRRLAAELNQAGLAGVRFYPVRRTPTSSVFAGKTIDGVALVVTDRRAIRPVRVGLAIAAALWKLYPERVAFDETARLIGDDETIEELERGEPAEKIRRRWELEKTGFLRMRARALLY